MNRMFMTRRRAVSRILGERKLVLEAMEGRLSPMEGAEPIAQLEKLLVDVRAGRIDDFVLSGTPSSHVFITWG